MGWRILFKNLTQLKYAMHAAQVGTHCKKARTRAARGNEMTNKIERTKRNKVGEKKKAEEELERKMR